MNEETTNPQKLPEQLSDILLVLDKEKMKIQALKSIDKNGEMQTVAPTKRNQNQFMNIDNREDFLVNFISNFWSQLKNPTQFRFFKVSADKAVEKAKELQKQVDTPSVKGEELLKQHEIKLETKQEQKQENDMATSQTTPEQGNYSYSPDQIDWDTMNSLGLSKEYLEKRNLLDPLLRGYKTNELLPIGVNMGGSILRTDARLSLQQGKDGNVIVAIHGIKKEPMLHLDFFGHKFTAEDKKNLLETGNMGRVVDLKNTKTGELMPSIISIDKLTNDIIALRTEFIKVPDEIKGVKLNEEQKQTLMEGKPLQLEDMISTKGTKFSAKVQYNAEKRYPEFLFDQNAYNAQRQSSQQDKQQNQSQVAPQTFRGKELTHEQYKDFKAGQTVYIPDLIDKKGQTYNGYITFNKDTGKTGFEFPNQYKERMKATEEHKTQTKVNSKGKTNEATKNLKEPLKKGQQKTKNEKQQEQQNNPKAPAKSKGRKVS